MTISGDGGRHGVDLEFLVPFVPGDDDRPWKKRGKDLLRLLEALQSEHMPKVVETARILLEDGWRLRLAILGVACVPSRRANNSVGDHFEGEPEPWGEYFKALGCPILPEMVFGSPRSLPEIHEACEEAFERTWYERSIRHLIEVGDDPHNPGRKICPEVQGAALEAQMRVEAKYGRESLEHACECPFEAGMLNGKLSALRFILGEPWDNLDT